MKSLRTSALPLFASVFGALLCSLVPAFGQGALTPPGAPAPLGRTLTQVEPRTDLSTLPSSATAVISISQPGSYYATGNIAGAAGKHTIEVLAAGVTIDLNGFSLSSTDAASSAIQAVSFLSTTVRNGRIVGGAYGVRATSRLVCTDLLVEGGTSMGILGGVDSHVLRCRVSIAGIQLLTRGLVEDCITTGAAGVFVGGSGIVRGTRVVSGGIVAGVDSQVHECNITSAPVCGIEVGDRGVIRDCNVNGAARSGFLADQNSRLLRCAVSGAGSGAPLSTDAGFALGVECVAENCTARQCFISGFVGSTSVQFRNCVSTFNVGNGFVCGNQSRLTDCTAASNNLLGFSGTARCVLTGCVATANTGGGITLAGVGGVVERCLASGSSAGGGIRVDSATVVECEAKDNVGAAGIRASTGSTVLRNTCNSSGTAAVPQNGFFIEGGRSRVEGNHAYNNTGYGFEVTNTSSSNSVLVIGNSAGSNDLGEFLIGAGNAAGPILAPASVLTTTVPTANFNL